MRIAIDTAILIRGNVRATGSAKDLLLKAIPDSGTRLVLSPYVLAEVDRVLRYTRIQALYQLTDEDIWQYLRLLESIADVVDPAEGPPIVYTALAGQADILCTVDKHFYEPNVLSDVQLLHFLRKLIPGS